QTGEANVDIWQRRRDVEPGRGSWVVRTFAASGQERLFHLGVRFEVAVPFAAFVAVDPEAADRLALDGLVIEPAHLRAAADVADVLGAGEAVGLQLGEPAVAPGRGDLVGRRLSAAGHVTPDDRSTHHDQAPSDCIPPGVNPGRAEGSRGTARVRRLACYLKR